MSKVKQLFLILSTWCRLVYWTTLKRFYVSKMTKNFNTNYVDQYTFCVYKIARIRVRLQNLKLV